MNAGIVLSFHGSINGIIEKAGGNAKKVSELMLIRKYAERFDKVFVFSHDSKSCEHHMPDNCSHIKLRNRFLYIAFGWVFLYLRQSVTRWRQQSRCCRCSPAGLDHGFRNVLWFSEWPGDVYA